MEKALVWFITKETSRTKPFQLESSAKLAQYPAQAMTKVIPHLDRKMEVSFQKHIDCESSMGAEAGFTKGEESVS